MSCPILAGDANSQSMSPTLTPVMASELEVAEEAPAMIDPVQRSPIENIDCGKLKEGEDERWRVSRKPCSKS